MADYQRWMKALESVKWLVPPMAETQGFASFSDFSRHLIALLREEVPTPESLRPHLVSMSEVRFTSHVVSRTHLDELSNPTTCSLGYESAESMREACKIFYRALPITLTAMAVLQKSFRHIRRQAGVRIVGDRSPNARPGETWYDWRGERPSCVMAFFLLTKVCHLERAEGIEYLDFLGEGLLWEPAQRLAQEILACWTGVDIACARFDRQREYWELLPHPMRKQQCELTSSPTSLVPAAALEWLYDRIVISAWHDLALEVFSRIGHGKTIGYRVGAPFIPNRATPLRVEAEVRLPESLALKRLDHPLLVHARSTRQQPRGWAAAVLQRSTGGHTTLLSRAAAFRFGTQTSPMVARWELPG